ncbi:MAG TPA: Ada metal-binding domain-containing protein [Haliscomenobacter sp.]|mgnify:FL=1|nr:Ada metal-binding domain-containing protein [Haliscomenobacter sp.]
MLFHEFTSDAELKRAIRSKAIVLGGNKQLKIYGTLHCASGKRMKRANRVFFASVQEAIKSGFRPCGHCMKSEYQIWKNEPVF